MSRTLLLRFAVTLITLGTAACGGETLTSSSAPATVAARLFTIPPAKLPAYHRGLDRPLTPAIVASQIQIPNEQKLLQDAGMVSGDEAEYAPAPQQAPLFDTINSQSMIFSGTPGATSFFAAEQKRVGAQPSGGSIDSLSALAHNADASAAYISVLPGSAPDRAYFFLARKGRVVVELFGHPRQGQQVDPVFLSLVTMQDDLLTMSPDTPQSSEQ